MNPGVAIITGAGSGVGRAVALRLGGSGWAVGLIGRTPAKLESVASEIRALQGVASHVSADVSDPEAISNAMRSLETELGPIRALICAAGVGLYGPVADYTMEHWQETLNTNLTGVFVCCQTALASLIEQRGLIVAIGSGAGKQGYANLAAYSASKFGLIGFMQSLAAEVSDAGVKVCTGLPGSILSDFGGRAVEEKRAQQETGRKYLEPDDVADAIDYLIN